MKKTDHGSFAFLIEYNGTDEEMYHRELNVLQLLKGEHINEYKQKKFIYGQNHLLAT